MEKQFPHKHVYIYSNVLISFKLDCYCDARIYEETVTDVVVKHKSCET